MCYCGSQQQGKQAGPIKSCLEINTQRTAGYLCYWQAADSKSWGKKNPHWDKEGREKPQSWGWENKKKQRWPLKTDCFAVLSWSRCACFHNSTQGLIQFFVGGKMIKPRGRCRLFSLAAPSGGVCGSISIIKCTHRRGSPWSAPLQPPALQPAGLLNKEKLPLGNTERCCPVNNYVWFT